MKRLTLFFYLTGFLSSCGVEANEQKKTAQNKAETYDKNNMPVKEVADTVSKQYDKRNNQTKDNSTKKYWPKAKPPPDC